MKKYNLIISILSLLGMIIGYSLTVYPEKLGVCNIGDIICIDNNPLIFGLGYPLVVISFFVFVVSITLFFVSDEIWRSWFKFSSWYLPLSVIAIALFPSQTHNLFLTDPFDKKFASLLLSIIFLLLSLLLIALKSYKLRKNSKSPPNPGSG